MQKNYRGVEGGSGGADLVAVDNGNSVHTVSRRVIALLECAAYLVSLSAMLPRVYRGCRDG